jgi:hypothetical protein
MMMIGFSGPPPLSLVAAEVLVALLLILLVLSLIRTWRLERAWRSLRHASSLCDLDPCTQKYVDHLAFTRRIRAGDVGPRAR